MHALDLHALYIPESRRGLQNAYERTMRQRLQPAIHERYPLSFYIQSTSTCLASNAIQHIFRILIATGMLFRIEVRCATWNAGIERAHVGCDAGFSINVIRQVCASLWAVLCTDVAAVARKINTNMLRSTAHV